VAVRKVEGLLSAGAKRVRVVAPAFHSRMSEKIERIPQAYRREHLNGAELVFAATDDPRANDAVVRDAKALNLLVCRSDNDEDISGDFATPAVIRHDPLLVTISTGGSPALAAKIRDALEKSIDPRWIAMSGAMQTLRPKIRAIASLAPSRRKEIFRALASDEAIDTVQSDGMQGLLRWLQQNFEELGEIQ